jgi:hypothetical protein
MKHTVKKILSSLLLMTSLVVTPAQAKSLVEDPDNLNIIQMGSMCMTTYYNLSVYFAVSDEMNKMINLDDPRLFLEKSYRHAKTKYDDLREMLNKKEIELIEQGYNYGEIQAIGMESARMIVGLIQQSANLSVQDKSTTSGFIRNMINQTDACDQLFFSLNTSTDDNEQ